MRREQLDRNELSSLRAPTSNYILYLAALLGVPLGLYLGGLWVPLTLVSMIVLHHGGHEAVHGTLFPARSKRMNAASGWVGFALLGQNFILQRWSHLTHHRFGRLHAEYTIDRSPASRNRAYYYTCLLGASNLYHEVAGYLYPLLGWSRLHLLSRRFKTCYYLRPSYLWGQTFVLAANVGLWWLGGWAFLACKILFTVYWGATQNVAHYALDVGPFQGSRFASRTYRLPRLLEFLLFRSGPYHLEHHLLPGVPGPRLHQPEVERAIRLRIGRDVLVRGGLWDYLRDLFAQYSGPDPASDRESEWSAPVEQRLHS